MEKNVKEPGLFLALAVVVLLVSGFLVLIHVAMSGLTPQEMRYNFSFRGAANSAAKYFRDFKRGGETADKSAEKPVNDPFSGSGEAVTLSDDAPGSYRETGRYTDSAEGTFDKDYDRDYEGYGGNGIRSWADINTGGSASGGYADAGRRGSAGESSSAGELRPADKAAAAGSGDNGATSAPRTAFRGQTSEKNRAAGSGTRASMPMKNLSANAGGRPLSGGFFPGDGNGKNRKTDGINAGPVKNFGAALSGGDEGMKAASLGGFNSKMSGGAAAAAAPSNTAAPAASSPQKSSAPGKTANTAAKISPYAPPGMNGGSQSDAYTPADQDLLKSVVSDKLNGAEVDYLPDGQSEDLPDEALLEAGAIAGADDGEDDPEDFDSLPPERKQTLKTEIHAFLKTVENKYGAMADISHTPCSSTPGLCKDHGLRRNYLTMTTRQGAQLVLGVKYVRGKWRRYTIDFNPQGSGAPENPE